MNKQEIEIYQALAAGQNGPNQIGAYLVFEVEHVTGPVRYALVADTYGDSPKGAKACQLVTTQMYYALAQQSPIPIGQQLVNAFNVANTELHEAAVQDPALLDARITVAAAAIVNGNLLLTYVGDNVAYLLRNGIAKPISLNHKNFHVPGTANLPSSLLGMSRNITVNREIALYDRFDAKETAPGHYKTSDTLSLRPNDSLLICSGEVVNRLSDDEIQAVLREAQPDDFVNQLIDTATTQIGYRAMTAVLLHLQEVTTRAAGSNSLVRQLIMVAGALVVISGIFFGLMQPTSAVSRALSGMPDMVAALTSNAGARSNVMVVQSPIQLNMATATSAPAPTLAAVAQAKAVLTPAATATTAPADEPAASAELTAVTPAGNEPTAEPVRVQPEQPNGAQAAELFSNITITPPSDTASTTPTPTVATEETAATAEPTTTTIAGSEPAATATATRTPRTVVQAPAAVDAATASADDDAVTPTASVAPSATTFSTPTSTQQATQAAQATDTVAPTNTAANTAKPTATTTPRATTRPTQTDEPISTNTPPRVAQAAATTAPTRTATETAAVAPTVTPTATTRPTNTPRPTATSTATALATVSSATATATPASTQTSIATSTATGTAIANVPATATNTAQPTATSTVQPTAITKTTATAPVVTPIPTATPTADAQAVLAADVRAIALAFISTPAPTAASPSSQAGATTTADDATESSDAAAQTPLHLSDLNPVAYLASVLLSTLKTAPVATNTPLAQANSAATISALSTPTPAALENATAEDVLAAKTAEAKRAYDEIIATLTAIPHSTSVPAGALTATVGAALDAGRAEATGTPSPTPTLVAGTPTPSPTPVFRPQQAAAASVRSIEPVRPQPGEAGRSFFSFEWRADGPLQDGQKFELVLWRPEQDPLNDGFGLAAPTTNTHVNVDLDRLDNTLGGLFDEGEYRWGVLLVTENPYRRLLYLGGGSQFFYDTSYSQRRSK
ncbi:MAG: hypothetical protein H6641_15160 [Caldilineaceae bacterium]|nr:hypothetical protein [Caldilineaceae bacterium]